MSAPLNPSAAWASPLEWVGRRALAVASYLGALALLPRRAALCARTRPEDPCTFRSLVAQELGWMFGMGLVLVGLVHVGLGSFLSMQSYFGGTFVEGTGAVVGVGLFRNVAPLMSGMVFAGLLGARIAPELRLEAPWADDPLFGGARATDRLVAARLVAATVAGFILCLWACVVGTFVGWRVASALMGLSTHSFFDMLLGMMWARDVVGVLIKGALFGAVACLFACHEGLRGATEAEAGPGSVPNAACRAVCFSALAMMIGNSGWFLLMYHSGPAFGPTLMAAPNS